MQTSFLTSYLPFSSSADPEKTTTALLHKNDVGGDAEYWDLKPNEESEDLSATSVEDSEEDDESSSNNSMVLTRRPNAGESNDAESNKQTMNDRNSVGVDNSSSSMPKKSPTTPMWVYTLLVIMVAVTIFAIPNPLHVPNGERPTVHHVFYYGWLTAVSTGLGAVPFAMCPAGVDTFWVGVSNAVAAGMMIAASLVLTVEGVAASGPLTALGVGLGIVFLMATKRILDEYEDLKVGVLGGTDARKALLVFLVMTLHSFSEGVGVGVSFGGEHGNDLGVFISASLAVHNVPEGLAIAVVLLPRGLSVLTACVWAIATSLPQPLMAVPAYLFVHYFIPVLPVGLGFASGAMAWVALFELLVEAVEDTSLMATTAVAIPSMATMLLLQYAMASW